MNKFYKDNKAVVDQKNKMDKIQQEDYYKRQGQYSDEYKNEIKIMENLKKQLPKDHYINRDYAEYLGQGRKRKRYH